MAFGESTAETPVTMRQQALRTLARTVLRQLKQSGCSRGEMVSFANHFLAMVSDDLRGDNTPPSA